MSETLRVILELVGALLTGLIMFVLGQRSERRRQSLLIRAEMLKSVEEWLGGTEKIIQMNADSLIAISQGNLLPATYTMEERRKAAQVMGESRAVFAILESGSLKIHQTKKLADALTVEITEIAVATNEVITKQPAIFELAASQPQEAAAQYVATIELLRQLSFKVGKAYSLIAQIKTAFV